MTKCELEKLIRILLSIHTDLAFTRLLLGEVNMDKLPDEVRNDMVAYKERVEKLTDKLRVCISKRLGLFSEVK